MTARHVRPSRSEMGGAMGTDSQTTALPAAHSVLAVCAHPDYESFGLGTALEIFATQGSSTAVLVFTNGEASTLGLAADLRSVRRAELSNAASELGVGQIELFDHPDGSLADEPFEQLVTQVGQVAMLVGADLLLAFDRGGITGHSDHQRATDAAVAYAERAGLSVLAWVLPQKAALSLNREFATSFVGRDDEHIDIVVLVNRTRQRRAIACHTSQSTENPVLSRHLELLDDREYFRWLRLPTAGEAGYPDQRARSGEPHRPVREDEP